MHYYKYYKYYFRFSNIFVFGIRSNTMTFYNDFSTQRAETFVNRFILNLC